MSYLPTDLPAQANKTLGSRAAASCVTGSCLAQPSRLLKLGLHPLPINPKRRYLFVKWVFPGCRFQQLPLNSTTLQRVLQSSEHGDCCLAEHPSGDHLGHHKQTTWPIPVRVVAADTDQAWRGMRLRTAHSG